MRAASCEGRPGHGWRVVQELLFKFHEFGDNCEARLKISYPRIPFRLELLNGLVEVSSGSSDLLINENCTLLQITPDVAHWVMVAPR